MVEWVPRSAMPLEAKNDSGLVTEIALVLVALSKGVPEPCQHIIELCRPDGHGMGHRNVDPSTNDEIERIVAGVIGGGASGLTGFK